MFLCCFYTIYFFGVCVCVIVLHCVRKYIINVRRIRNKYCVLQYIRLYIAKLCWFTYPFRGQQVFPCIYETAKRERKDNVIYIYNKNKQYILCTHAQTRASDVYICPCVCVCVWQKLTLTKDTFPLKMWGKISREHTIGTKCVWPRQPPGHPRPHTHKQTCVTIIYIYMYVCTVTEYTTNLNNLVLQSTREKQAWPTKRSVEKQSVVVVCFLHSGSSAKIIYSIIIEKDVFFWFGFGLVLVV